MLDPGQRVGNYEVINFLGSGGTSEVYRVRSSASGDDCARALKLLRDDLRHNQAWHARMYNEAMILEGLDLPGIVRILEYGDWDCRPFLVLEYLPGRSLASRPRPLPLSVVLSLGSSLAGTLVGLHARGIVHRDIKPHNILFTADGEPKLSDFGHAKNERAKAEGTIIPHSTETGAFLGTRVYAAPEQLLNAKAVTDRADVYALGVLLFELLTGSLPFSSTDLEQPESMARGAPLLSSRFSSAPPLLTKLIGRMLAKRYQDRPTAAELVTTLSRIRRDPSTASHGLVRRTVAALAVLGLVLLPAPRARIDTRGRLARAYQSFEDNIDRETLAEAQGSLDSASELLTQAEAMSESVHAKHRYKAADLARAQGHLQDAARQYEASLIVWRQRATAQGMPDDHRSFAICANNLGDVLMHLGQLDRALALYQDAWHHQEILLSNEFSNRPQLAYTQYRIALLHIQRRDTSEAQKALQNAWDLLAGRHDHPDIPLYRARVAELLAEQHDGPEAIRHAQQAFDIGREAWQQHPRSKRHRLAYLRAVEQLGQQRGDKALLDEALVGKRALWRGDPVHGLWAHELLESLLRYLRHDPARQEIAREAHDVLHSMEDHGQWLDDPHVLAWRHELSALETQADGVLHH
jgi:serine/threonine protein kinase